MMESAGRGCHLCALVVESLERENDGRETTPQYRPVGNSSWIRLVWTESGWGEDAFEVQTSQHDPIMGRSFQLSRLKVSFIEKKGTRRSSG